MNWIEMTPPEIEKAVTTCKGVCVVPMGCLESHGNHMPVGADSLQAEAIVCRAAEIEPVVKYPMYFQTQIVEARHLHGTIALPHRVIWDLFEATLDEIARNGFDKIVIANNHGGNYALLSYFAMRRMEKPRDYVLYLYNQGHWPCEGIPELKDLREGPFEGHGGEAETSLLLAIRADLVKMDKIQKDVRSRLKRFKLAGDFDTGLNWFAGNPEHYQGGGEYATARKGEILLEAAAKKLAAALKDVKKDTSAKRIQDEFFRTDVAAKRVSATRSTGRPTGAKPAK